MAARRRAPVRAGRRVARRSYAARVGSGARSRPGRGPVLGCGCSARCRRRRCGRRRRLGRLARLRHSARSSRSCLRARRLRSCCPSFSLAFYDHVVLHDGERWWFEALVVGRARELPPGAARGLGGAPAADARAVAACGGRCRRRSRSPPTARPGTSRRWRTAAGGSRPASCTRPTCACGSRRNSTASRSICSRVRVPRAQPRFGAFVGGRRQPLTRAIPPARGAAGVDRADQGDAPADR